ncbi:protein lethal(2)k10201 [Bicyclus anynana]|uniref:Protein lethal(2)k10201 n=1 Tax=Bicyclus anynana TaxID=110368 RepID=A0A6J1MLW9_BICAN|nr:protein lethal(2)k10201 [Bicyclus anynana]XP_023933753.2 protein lethal(2)k10201 [Bicyclus anynana]XP_023933754.2 protein lethal(2)k10201 [Bicyclus anynana]
MEDIDILSLLGKYGIGRRKLDDDLFSGDKLPARFGIYDEDEENQCHQVTPTQCTVPGCNFTADSIVNFEKHYNSMHRYSCSQCKKVLPSPHLLDLHVQEQHDSFFAVMAERKPSYSCYIEECKEKFTNAEERLNHCVKIHKLPKDYRFDSKPKKSSKNKKSQQDIQVDQASKKDQKFNFTNNRQKVFSYTGKKFTQEQNTSASVDMDAIMIDLKENLPQT